ncbi:unnamed protein product [Soboliphyme baturini]|uniref:ADAM_spacer1 domain-containing protein n=1 Tax=Soboliphyme baturini TaxID=241478 RepID=A0A183J7Z3_9BILA|nr:unnamed protein product [Soboliphyme baturini]
MCVDGSCRPEVFQKAGCDHRLGSDLERDKCGVCGGDGTTCRFVSGHFNEQTSYGYNFVMKIPIGATNIHVDQHAWNDKKEDDNYLALQNAKGEFILNGHFQVSVFFQEIPVRGTVIEYSGSDNVVERINSTKPILEELFLHVMTSDVLTVGDLHPPDIRYDYFIPNNSVRSAVKPDYFWRAAEEWTRCSKLCHGTQELKIICIEQEGEQIVSDSYCEGQPKPSRATRVCNLHCELK